MNSDFDSEGRFDSPSDAHHLATISYLQRFWDVYLELAQDVRGRGSCRARVRFSPVADAEAEHALHTTTIIVEPSYDEALNRALILDDRQLLDLLRSCLPG